MYHIDQGHLKIFFGDQSTAFEPALFKRDKHAKNLLAYKPFSVLTQQMALDRLIFLHQVHGAQGLVITSTEQVCSMPAFTQPGDFIITNCFNIGIAIATADCLPIILYHDKPLAIAAIHAGWRSSVQEIVIHVLQKMKELFDITMENLRVFLGPCAKHCCYTVGHEVIKTLDSYSQKDAVVIQKSFHTYFDMVKFNELLLKKMGIKGSAIDSTTNFCTICNFQWCSFRRQRSPLRQMTVAVLQENVRYT